MRSILTAPAVYLTLASACLIAPASAQLSTVEAGFVRAGSSSFAEFCSGSRSYASFTDGSYVVFDGNDVEHRATGGFLIRRLASFPFFVFPSFVKIAPDGQTIYLGESSAGKILTIDMASGAVTELATLSFNFDLEFDVDPGFAYVSASTAGFGTNSIHRLDLLGGTTSEIARLNGFSGPLSVNDFGDVLIAELPSTFPFPNGGTRVLLFDDAVLDSGAALSGADAIEIVSGLNGVSSIEFDRGNEQFFLMETNTTSSGFGSFLGQYDAAGARQGTVIESSVFAGGIELVDAGIGTRFGPYQPGYTGLRFSESSCFSQFPISERVEIRGARPTNKFVGPGIGGSGSATLTLRGAPEGGFASLWLARSTNFQLNDVITDLGGFYPIALRAGPAAFARRFPLGSIPAGGELEFAFMQDVSIEGAFLAQWIVFDANMTAITSSTYAINRSQF